MSELLIDRLYKFRRKKRHVRDVIEAIDTNDTPVLEDIIPWMKDRYSRIARIVGKIERRLGPDHPDVKEIEGFDEGGEG
jgi:hypothetical protein